MSLYTDRAATTDSVQSSFDETLRLFTQVDIPDGLEARIHARLQAQPTGRFSGLFIRLRELFAPSTEPSFVSGSMSGWARGLAAASLAVAVAGGGWVVTSNAHFAPVGGGIAPALNGGFGGANAIRRPQPLQPPVVIQPKSALPAAKTSIKDKTLAKTTEKPANK